MWETNMITPLCFSDNRKKGRRRGVSRKTRCCVMYLLSTSTGWRGVAVMKRQHEKKFGEERKKEAKGDMRTKENKIQKVVRKRTWEEGCVEAQ